MDDWTLVYVRRNERNGPLVRSGFYSDKGVLPKEWWIVTEPFELAPRKVIVVEGKTDEERLLRVLIEPVTIVCTRGTLSYEKVEEWIVPLQDAEVYVLVDADKPGMKLRNQLKQELPNAKHIYTTRVYREVARTPLSYLAKILHTAHFTVDEQLLEENGEAT